MTETPIAINKMNGHPIAGGPAAIIRAALNGAAPITVTGKDATGDIVWLAPITERVWGDDALTVKTSDIATTFQHPTYGEVLYAYIDMSRVDQAPKLVALEREDKARANAAHNAAMARANAVVPSCHNCGNCPQCC